MSICEDIVWADLEKPLPFFQGFALNKLAKVFRSRILRAGWFGSVPLYYYVEMARGKELEHRYAAIFVDDGCSVACLVYKRNTDTKWQLTGNGREHFGGNEALINVFMKAASEIEEEAKKREIQSDGQD